MLTAATQVSANGKLIHPRATCDVAHGTVGVVMEHDRGALLWCEPLERVEQLLVRVWIVKGALWQRSTRETRLALQVASREPKG
jgi:hypothetical protein